MLVLPKSLLHVRAGLISARIARRLRQAGVDVPAQEIVRREAMARLAATAFGREHGLTADTTFSDLQRKVPLRTPELFAPYVDRLRKGETNVLSPEDVHGYIRAAGAADGQNRWLPVTDGMLEHAQRAALASLFFYTARTGHTEVLRGRHLLLCGADDLGNAVAQNLPTWANSHWFEPGADIAKQKESPEKMAAILDRTRALNLSLLAGNPAALLRFAHTLAPEPGERTGCLVNQWPQLECLVHGGRPLGPYADELRQAAGPRTRFHEVYAGPEAIVAAQDTDAGGGLRLITDAGIFFEFLALDDFDEKRLESLGTRTVTLEGVRTGVDYALVLTTPTGLTRYVNGDLVRFTSKEPPRLVQIGHCRLHLNALGERVSEKDLTDTLVEICRRHNWTIVNFHVAPLFAPSVIGQNRGRHEWWVELKPFTTETPTGPLMAIELDANLQRLNPQYEAKRRSGALEAPFVRLVMPGVFAHWMQETGRSDAAGPTPRCRSDRDIADALARIARFSAD